jgi:hypothetical protein
MRNSKTVIGVLVVLGTVLLILFVWRFWAGSSQSLAGVDQNGDGLRDDVEQFINDTYQDEKTRIVAQELHRAFQGAVLHPDAWDWKRMIYASDCLDYINPPLATEITRKIEAKTADTPLRIRSYWKANARLSGGVYPASAPSRKEACAFDARLQEE